MKYIEVKINCGEASVTLFNTLQEAFNNLKEWMLEMVRELDVEFSNEMINGAPTVEKLAEIADYFYWGENDYKIYHLFTVNDDGSQEDQLV